MFEYEKLNDLDIFVYCGGKCGSSTLHHTFKNNNFKSYKIHDNNYFKYLCSVFKKDIGKTIYDVINFNVIDDKKTVYIIDSYRTPIERKISSFFQNIDKHIHDYKNKTIDDMINVFNTKFLYNLEEYHSIDEVLNYYGLIPFCTFDFENKYNIIKKENIIFIKLRFNDVDKWGEILSQIFEKKIVIHNFNLTKNKEINKLYNQFKEKYKVPHLYLTHYLTSDINFKIYNNDKEQNEYINYWNLKSF